LNKVIFYFISYLFLSSVVFASQEAVVDTLRAVIYADVDKKSPIGYVRKGKKLMVGDIKRRNGTMLPVMVNGQVGWIKVVDLFLPYDQRASDIPRSVTEHEVLIEDKVKDPLDQNNFLSFKLSPSTLNLAGHVEIFNGTSEEFDGELDSATEFDFMYEHKNPYHSIHWGVGLSYLQAEVSPLNISGIIFKGGLTWVPFRTSLLNIELYSNLSLSGGFKFESEGVGEYKSNMYGLDYGALVRLFPRSQFGFFLGLGGTYYKFDNLSPIILPGNIATIELEGLSGRKFELGMSYKF